MATQKQLQVESRESKLERLFELKVTSVQIENDINAYKVAMSGYRNELKDINKKMADLTAELKHGQMTLRSE